MTDMAIEARRHPMDTFGFDITFPSAICLGDFDPDGRYTPHSPHERIFRKVIGRLTVMDADSEADDEAHVGKVVGKIEGYLVLGSMVTPKTLARYADDLDQQLAEFFAWVVTGSSRLRKAYRDAADNAEDFYRPLLYLNFADIEPLYRGKGLGLFMFREMITLLSMESAAVHMAVCKPFPTEERPGVTAKAGAERLRSYWQHAGFSQLGRSPFWVRNADYEG